MPDGCPEAQPNTGRTRAPKGTDTMSHYQTERATFIDAMTREGMTTETSRLILRDANTLTRLAVAACNGDWPCDNGTRKVKPCAECGCGYAPSTLDKRGVCPSCRAESRVTRRCEPCGIVPIFNGDPRGAVVKLKVPSGRTDDWGQEGICVPTRYY